MVRYRCCTDPADWGPDHIYDNAIRSCLSLNVKLECVLWQIHGLFIFLLILLPYYIYYSITATLILFLFFPEIILTTLVWSTS